MKRLPERIREILSKRRVRRFLTRVVSIVGALVVFATTYALVLPAITMEKQAACGIEEHQHDDSCFELQLICGEEESETHQHTDECYERVLVCEKPVHTHSTECYETFEETYEKPADTDAGTEEDTMSGQTAGTDSSETENGTEAAAADGIRDTDSTGASDENTDRDETGSEKADAKDIDPGRSGSTEDSDDSDKEFTENHKSSSSKVQADAVNLEDGTIEGESLDAAEVAVTEDKTYAGLQTTLDLAGVLSDRTGLYYYPAKYDEDGIADTTAIRSDSATDWEKVKDDTQIASADFVRVYLAYTIPAGTLNKDHYTARYRLPGALRLTENRVEAINKSKNGISKEMEASTEITRSSTNADFEEDFPTDEETWLGAEAIEGTRTPDRILDKAETEYISATVKVENIYKSGEYRGQDLIFTFTPYTVRKNQTTYDADGTTLAEGEKVRGFFSLDFNPDQISCDESGTAEILFAKESDVNDVASGQFAQKEIRRVLHLKDSQNSISGNGAIGEDATDTAAEAVNTDNTEQDRTEKKQTGKGNQTEENKDGTDAVTADQKDGLAAAEEKFLTGSVIAASGEAYEINVTYGEDAQIPDGSELRVREILESDSEYKDYSEQAVEKVEEVAAQIAEENADAGDNAAAKADSSTGNADGNNPDGQALPRKSNGYVRVFDIEIWYNGQKIEPEEEVLVEIRLLDAPENKETSLDVVHFAEDGPEVLSTDQNTNTRDTADTSIQFTTDAFSVYTIVGTELKKEITLTTPDGEDVTYVVSVSYGPEANIPEGAYLDVTEYDSLDDKYIEAWDAVVTAKKNAHEVFDENHLGLSALDISIKDSDGNNIEPTEGTSVKVSIQMKELPKNVEQNMLNDTMEVQHLNESTGAIAVETVAKAEDVNIQNGIATAAFTIDSFSTFTITWSLPAATVSDANASFRLRYQTPNQWSTNAYSQNVRVWYVDESGNNIQKPTGRNDVTYNANNYPNVTINLSDYEALSGYEFIEARYSANTTNKPNGQTIDSVQFVLSGNSRTANYIYNENIVATNTRTDTTNNDTGNVYLVYRSNNQRVITVHYGYMNGDEFIEFDSLPDGAQTSYSAPAFRGDQLNLRYEISGKDFVTVRMGNPSSGTQISPLLQTENQTNYAAYPYWRYRILNTLTVNNGINEWQRFTSNEDLYVIYRDTPTEKSYDDQDLDPEDLSAPATNKNVKNNQDGTYDIDLSVTGSSNSVTNKTHANVVIVLDTSSSMDGTDTGVAGQTRLQAAKNAITNVLADELFGFNSTDDPEAIEVAFVDFSHRVRNEMTKDTIYSGVVNGSGYNQFVSLINGLNNNGGTNYDTAIEAANSILWNDADPVYVIFVTDGDTVSRGYLEYDEAGNTFPTDWDGGTYYNAAGGNDYLARARSAAQVQVNKILANSNNKFYSIGVFGNVQYLQALGGTYLGQANNETAIREAFTTIIDEIALNLGYEDVTIHDGITAMTSTSLVNGVVNEFHYSVTKNGVTTEYEDGAALQAAYPDIGLASYANKQVTWEMGDQYMLEDGVTYTVSFTVWPSQDAYDYLADFSNGVKDITAQSTDTKKQFFVQIGSSTYQYVADKGWTTDIPAKDTSVFITDSQMKEAIEAASSVTYYLRTNTSATVDYTSVKYVDGEETERKTVTGSEIKDPNGKMVLDSTKMKVAKEFAHNINSASPYTKLNFYLKRDGKYYNKDGTTSDELDLEKIYTIELPKNNNWWDEIFIAPGLIEKETGEDPTLPPLETGHDYSVEEKIITGNVFEYEFTPQTVRPMVIGTTLTFLVKKDKYNTNSGNAKEYELPDVVGSGTSIYYVASENNGSLIGTNRKTSELDITKVITDVDADESGQIKVSDPRYNESFTYRVTLSVPADGDPSGIMGYEYVPRLSDPVNGTTRVNIYGYQEDAGSTVYEPDTTRFKGRTYGAWNTQAYKYFVQTYQSGTQTLVTRDEDGNFIWLQGGDGVTAAKKETIGGKDYYTITLDVTIKMDEVYRFNNLPSGTKYKIQEIYWNKYKADGGSAARTIVSDNSNIDDSGYDININTTGSVSTTDVENDTVSGTIEELDTRYYNQFENTLSDEPDIIQLQVTKHLQGYNWSGERYYFRLSAIDGAPMPASLNEQLYISSSSGSDDKSYAFGYIRFTAPGTYQYKITELDPATAGISGYTAVDGVTGYGAEKTITITVDEDLKVTEVTGEDTTFANKLVNTTFTNIKGILVQLLKLGDGIFDRPLDGVTFELYEDQACTKKVTKDVLGNDIGINGVITTADGGMADLGTLKTGTYYLKETGTVDGYNKLTDLISVEVKADGTVTYNQPSYTDSNKGPDLVYQDENGDYYYYSKIRGDETDQYADSSEYTLVGYRIVVSNLSGVELPHTGGSGTLPYTLSGLALMMASALMYGFRMRRRERRLN